MFFACYLFLRKEPRVLLSRLWLTLKGGSGYTLAENGLLQTEFWPAPYKYKSNSRELAAAASFDQNLAARTLVFSRDVAEENRLQFRVGNWRVLVLFLIGQTEM